MSELSLLLETIDRAYNRRSWHGTNLRGSIRGLTAVVASWRPGKGRHNIWELVVHAAYWKYAVWRRLSGEPRGSFAIAGSNWFVRPDLTLDPAGGAWEHALKADVALLDCTHRQLRNAIAGLPARELGRKRGQVSTLGLIAGIAAHDLYHAGQIQLIKRLHGEP